jgi:anti-sigma factor RsiW
MAHLTLEELTAYVNGTAVETESQAHAAACDSCRSEAARWGAVAGGVRLLTAPSYPLPPLPDVATRARSPLWTRRRVALASAAAVAALLAGVYGLTSAFRPTGEPGTTATDGDRAAVAAALASTDCSNVKVAAGTLESVNGSRLVLRTGSGTAVTVSTSDFTAITRQVKGGLSDIANGKAVVVRGEGTQVGDTITATSVAIMPSSVDLPDGPEGLDLGKMLAQRGHASGTVADAGSDGFTVVRGDGSRVRIATSTSTTVIKQVTATVGELEKGEFTTAVGSLDDKRTLHATAVQQGKTPDASLRLPEPLPSGRPRSLPDVLPSLRPLPSGPKALPRDLFKGLGCDPVRLGTIALGGGD